MSLVHPGYAVGGADLSKWQYPVNFSILLPKLNYLIIRAGSIDGIIKEDPYYDDYWRSTVGFTKGAYWYWHPDYDAKLQAECFIDTVKSSGMYTANMGLYIDLEEKANRLPTLEVKKEFTEKVKTFLAYTDANITTTYNKFTGIYTSYPYWTNYLNYSSIPNLSRRTSWLAQYPKNYPMEKPSYNLPGFVKTHKWQFSRKGGKPDSAMVGAGKEWGVYSYGLDMNVWLGTKLEFENWFHCKPMPVDLTTNLPRAIKPFQSGYYIRKDASDMSLVVATTYTNPIEIMGAKEDIKGRLWYQVGKSMWFAAWLGEPIYK
jgi:GH25 family lysozyme M1 (1,4-beta-N-acetylmuramidase)